MKIFARILYIGLQVIVVLLVARFFLRLLDANSRNGIVAFIYDLSEAFLTPFRNIVPSTGSGGYIVEWSTLIAIAILLLIGAIIHRIIIYTSRRHHV